MNRRPDSETRILVAAIALIVIIAWATGANGIWTGQPLGAVR